LLISFIQETNPRCQDSDYEVFVWDNVSSDVNCYGDKKTTDILESTKSGKFFFNSKPINFDPGFGTGSYTVYFGRDLFTESLFGSSLQDNLSLGRAISIIRENGASGWKIVKAKLSTNPIIALGQAITKFGKVGGIKQGNIHYPNPAYMINRAALSNFSKAAIGLDKLYKAETYSLLIELQDAYALYMNAGGMAIKLHDNVARKMRLFTREVIVPDSLHNPEWKEDIDYVLVDGLNIAKLGTVISSMPTEGILYLSYTDNSVRVSQSGNFALREVGIKPKHITDIKTSFSKTSDKIKLKYSIGAWKGELLPLSIREDYSTLVFKDNIGTMVD
jgi:hypothetical protein